jgi:hypothetical protein
MIDIGNIKKYTIPCPSTFSLFGSAKEFAELPPTHQDQIFFLDMQADEYISSFASNAKLMTGNIWNPFEKKNFKSVDEFNAFIHIPLVNPALKKWLYRRGIPFKAEVFVLPNGLGPSILTTWKMVVNYSAEIFCMTDVMVFDRTLNWCLFFFHEDEMWFGRDNVYDQTPEDQKMES